MRVNADNGTDNIMLLGLSAPFVAMAAAAGCSMTFMGCARRKRVPTCVYHDASLCSIDVNLCSVVGLTVVLENQTRVNRHALRQRGEPRLHNRRQRGECDAGIGIELYIVGTLAAVYVI